MRKTNNQGGTTEMVNEVFGVNTVDVEKEVRQLVAIYKVKGRAATLEAWGYGLNYTLYGKDALIAEFLRVLFRMGNEEYINKVLETKDAAVLLDSRTFRKPFYDEYLYDDPAEYDFGLMDDLECLATDWAIYNLPILQNLMDETIEYMTKNPDYLEGCDAVNDMMARIKYEENCGRFEVLPFQEYVAPYIVEYLKYFNLETLTIDEVKVDEFELDYLQSMWEDFCSSLLLESILIEQYQTFMGDAVKAVLTNAGF